MDILEIKLGKLLGKQATSHNAEFGDHSAKFSGMLVLVVM